jgi:hypothetical protein
MPNADHSTAADVLRIIIARGQAAYRATLPEYDAELMATLARAEAEPTTPNNLGIVDEERQRALCLSCPLADCVGVESSACPIRQEQRRAWRNRKS